MAAVIDLTGEDDGLPTSRFANVTAGDVVRKLEAALNAPSAGARNEANGWIVEFKTSATAWKLSPALLNHGNPDVQHFGARIIADTVSNAWGSLNTETRHALPASLLKIISEGTQKAKFTRLTLLTLATALAGCFVRGVLGYCFVDDESSSTSSSSSSSRPRVRFTAEHVGAMKRALFSLRKNALTGLLEALGQMAELTVSLSSSWSKAYAARVRQELKTLTRETLVTIKWVLSADAPPAITDTLRNDALRCLQSWMKFGIQSDIMADMSDFFLGIFRFLASPTTFNTAVEVLDVAMSLKIRHVPTICAYVRSVNALKPMLMRARAEGGDDDDSGDVAVCTGIARLASRCGERHVAELISRDIPAADGEALCTLLLACACDGSRNVASLTFRFWNLFGAGLLHSRQAAACSHFKPYFHKLFQRLLSQLVYSAAAAEALRVWRADDFFAALDDAVDDDWQHFRATCAEPLQTCLDFLGADAFLRFLAASWTKALPRPNWSVLEGVLFVLHTVAGKLALAPDSDETRLALQFVQQAVKHCRGHPLLLHAGCLAIGSLARAYTDRQLLEQVLGFLFRAAVVDVACLPACCALKDIAKECSQPLYSNLPSIMQHLQKTIAPYLAGDQQHAASCRDQLLEAKVHLYNFLVMIAKHGSSEQTGSVVAWITKEIRASLQRLLDADADGQAATALSAAAADEQVECGVISDLEVLVNVYRHFIGGANADQSAHIVLSSLRLVWSHIERVVARWPGNDEVMDAVARLYSAVWRSCRQRATAVTPKMLANLVACFERYQFSFCLGAMHSAVVSLGADASKPDRWQATTARITALILAKFSAVAAASKGKSASSLSARLQQFNELVCSFFPLLEAVTAYSWQSLGRIPPAGIKSLFGLVATSIMFEDQEATTKGAVNLLLAMYRASATNPDVHSLFQTHGPIVVRAIITFAARGPVTAPVQKIIVRFLEQLIADHPAVKSYIRKLKETLNLVPPPSNSILNAFLSQLS